MSLKTKGEALIAIGLSLAADDDCCCDCPQDGDACTIEATATPTSDCCCFLFAVTIEGMDCEITRAVWDFGDGTTEEGNPVSHCFMQGDQSYEVVVTVTKNTDCVDEVFALVDDGSPNCACGDSVVADFTADQADDDPCCFQFTDASSSECANIVSWAWDFGDGTFSSQQSPLKCFDGTGPWDVSLQACDTRGCCDGVEMEVGPCLPPEPLLCPPCDPLPNSITVEVHGITGICAYFNGTYTLTRSNPFNCCWGLANCGFGALPYRYDATACLTYDGANITITGNIAQPTSPFGNCTLQTLQFVARLHTTLCAGTLPFVSLICAPAAACGLGCFTAGGSVTL